MYDDDFDDYLLDDYNDQLDELEDQEQFAYDMYESEVNEIGRGGLQVTDSTLASRVNQNGNGFAT